MFAGQNKLDDDEDHGDDDDEEDQGDDDDGRPADDQM